MKGVLSRMDRWWRKPFRWLCYRRGDGVHSPYAYHLITKVMRNHYPFYAFPVLAQQCRQAGSEIQPQDGELLFRLLHEWGGSSVLSVCSSDSPLLSYLSATGKARQMRIVSSLSASCVEQEVDASLCVRPFILVDYGALEDGDGLVDFGQYVMSREEQAMWVLHTPTCRHRQAVRRAEHRLAPVAVFDLFCWQVWVYRPALTRGRYQVYY